MSRSRGLPRRADGGIYLTEGGTETEIMYRHGFELPEFSMLPLLDNPKAMGVLSGMYRALLDVAAAHKTAVYLTGLDYRASPDWGTKLGYSSEALADANLACIAFLREVSAPYADGLPDIRIGGIVGPRGDAYSLNAEITDASAEDYHSVQMATLKRAGVDMACAMTFNSVPEAVGAARAAAAQDVPLCMMLTLDSTARLKSGPSLGEAIPAIDAATDNSIDFYAINCSHPLEFEPALDGGDWIQRLRGLRPNASKMEKIALCKLNHLEEGDPVDLGERMGDLARRYPQMDVWGGCCGTWEKHLDQIAGQVLAVRAAG
ncbi:homocysteine S-methyltransferase family protein [Fluviibacterium sp. DFM31]|uniref:Homocysteine S-methyltransferase family protein n=1 Tax=Meridianimarinicoccus marinus TaxID=3231483 RepID=A0ABV3L1C6_9RHOB